MSGSTSRRLAPAPVLVALLAACWGLSEPEPFDVQVDRALHERRLGRPESSLRHAREAIRLRPDLPAGHLEAARALSALANWEEAMAELRTALDLNRGRGVEGFFEGCCDEIEHLTSALGLHDLQVLLLERVGDPGGALDLLESRPPAHPARDDRYPRLLIALERFEEARAWIEAREASVYPPTWTWRVALQLAMGDVEAARRTSAAGVEDEADPVELMVHARVLRLDGDRERCALAAEQALSVLSATEAHRLASELESLGFLEEAACAWSLVLRGDPGRPEEQLAARALIAAARIPEEALPCCTLELP